MNVLTEIEGVNVERKQRTEAELYQFGLTNAIVIPDTVSGMAFGAVGLTTKALRSHVDDRVEYIHSEFDPSTLNQLRNLYRKRDALRRQLAELADQLSHQRYNRLVRDNTVGYRIIKIVKGWRKMTAYEWSIEHGHWETIQDEEAVTRTEFYERLIKYASLSPCARRSAYESLRQSRLADQRARERGADIAKNYVWRTNPRTIRVRNIPLFDGENRPIEQGANLHDIEMAPLPIYGTKKVPTIDWDTVRRTWSRRLDDIQPRQEALTSELHDVDEALDSLRPSSSHRFNRCVQLSGSVFHANNRNISLLAKDMVEDTFPRLRVHLHGDTGDTSTGWLPGDPTIGLTWSPWDTSRISYLCPRTVSNTDGLADEIAAMASQCIEFERTGIYPKAPDDWERVHEGRCYLSGNDSAYLSISSGVSFRKRYDTDPSEYCMLASRLVSSTSGDPFRLKRGQTSPEAVDEKIQSNLNALLAGRASGSEDVSFNMTRSVGELKDLPQTGSQASDFFRWLLATDKKERLYAFYIKGHKTPLYAYLRNYERKTNLLLGKFKIASFKAIKRTPTLAMLASAYLGWKFAVEPTIADATRIGRESFADLVASRRFLTRLYRTLDTRTRFVVLRRGFLVGQPVKQDKPVIVRVDDLPGSGTPFRDEVNLTREQIIAIMNCDATPFSVATLPASAGRGSFSVPYVETSKGLRSYLWFATDGRQLSYDERTRCALDSYSRATQVLGPEFYANPLLYISWVKGCVFARYGRNALTTLANDTTLAAKLDRLKVVKTAWDLSPLSFVLEWFTNLGDIIQNAQDILSTDTVGIMPIGGPWCRVTERFAMSRLTNAQRYSLRQKVVDADYYPMLRVRGARPEDRFWSADVVMVPKRIAWEWAVVDNTTGRAISRREWLSSLVPQLEKTGASVTNRVPIAWERELPSFRPSLRLDIGKGLTLLAMYLSGLRS